LSSNSANYEGSCLCGQVEIQVEGPPSQAGYCHCKTCRTWHACPVLRCMTSSVPTSPCAMPSLSLHENTGSQPGTNSSMPSSVPAPPCNGFTTKSLVLHPQTFPSSSLVNPAQAKAPPRAPSINKAIARTVPLSKSPAALILNPWSEANSLA